MNFKILYHFVWQGDQEIIGSRRKRRTLWSQGIAVGQRWPTAWPTHLSYTLCSRLLENSGYNIFLPMTSSRQIEAIYASGFFSMETCIKSASKITRSTMDILHFRCLPMLTLLPRGSEAIILLPMTFLSKAGGGDVSGSWSTATCIRSANRAACPTLDIRRCRVFCSRDGVVLFERESCVLTIFFWSSGVCKNS